MSIPTNETPRIAQDEWNPILCRVETAHPREFTIEDAEGTRRRYRLAVFEEPAGSDIGHSLLGEVLIVQTDNIVPEEAIVYVDKGTPLLPRLGIATAVAPKTLSD